MNPSSPNRLSDAFSPIDYQAELNSEQYAAVTAPDGPSLVLAGAGSGKTRTLTYRVAWLLEQGIWPGEILLLTFTNKAAREMLGRVEDLTGVPAFKFWGGTFHGIGQRILRKHGESIGLHKNYTVMDQGDAESLLGELIREIDSGYTKNKENPKPRLVGDMISYARNTIRPVADVVAERYPWLADLPVVVDGFAKAYHARKRERQLCDYDDLLELWLRLLNEDTEVREYFQNRFKHILVDEYQDTNKIQSEIINLLGARHRNLMIVGDNWQCIYTWRGAEFANMTDFAEVYPDRRIYKIETNYRSTPQVLDFANRMMCYHPSIDGYPLELRAHNPEGPQPWVVPSMDTRQQALFVVSRLEGLCREGRSLRDIAVLYRAHYQAMDLQLELSRAGIPFTITSGVRFFEQAHIRDIVAQLRLAANPRDSVAFTRLCMLLPRVGNRTAERLYAMVEKAAAREGISPIQALTHDEILKKVPADALDDYRDLAYTIQDLEEAMGGPPPNALPEEGMADLFTEVKSDEQRAASAQSPQDIVRMAVDGWYGDFMRTIFDNWQSRRDDLDSLVGFASRFDNMADLLAQLVLLNSETSDRSIDPEEDTVKLTTIHQAKGLEFPVVFVIGLADNLFPLKRAIEAGDVDEERRLFYVAVTRAMEELYLAFPKVTASGGPPQLLEPSRFLREVPDSYYEVLRMRTGW